MANRIICRRLFRNEVPTSIGFNGIIQVSRIGKTTQFSRAFNVCGANQKALLFKQTNMQKALAYQHKRSLRTHSKIRYITPFKDDEVYDIHDGYDCEPIILDNNEAEFLIIGGGVMGLALAYNLWRNIECLPPAKASKYIAPKIVVVERDPTMANSASARSVASIRQQYSHPSNIRMSLLSAEFFRDIKLHLGLAGHDVPDIQFQPQGYLFLSSEKGAETLMRNYATQIEQGAKVMLLTQNKLKEVFPWINTEGVELATYGLENEGWFDPWALMNAFKTKNKSLGIKYIHGEVVGFKKQDFTADMVESSRGRYTHPDGTQRTRDDDLVGAYIKLQNYDKPVYFKVRDICNCAGPWSGEIAKMMGIGVADPHSSDPIVKTELPVEPRKRWVYSFHCPDGPVYDCPLMVDPSGVYFRREGFNGMYICGMSPENDDDVDHSNLEVDYDFFYEEVWPRLAKRVPVFEKLKLKSAWGGYYEYNTFDQNAIIGKHPYYFNLSFLTGFSGHGIQMAYAASSCLAEMLTTGPDQHCKRVNPEPFGFNRLIDKRPTREMNIV